MKFRLLLLSLTIIMLLSFASCGQQGATGGNGTMENTETTQDTAKEDSDPKAKDKQEEDNGFSGLDVEESTEIILDEGQDIEIY